MKPVIPVIKEPDWRTIDVPHSWGKPPSYECTLSGAWCEVFHGSNGWVVKATIATPVVSAKASIELIWIGFEDADAAKRRAPGLIDAVSLLAPSACARAEFATPPDPRDAELARLRDGIFHVLVQCELGDSTGEIATRLRAVLSPRTALAAQETKR